MSKGKLLATLLATLDYDIENLQACVNALRKKIGTTLSPEALRNIVVEGREYLAYETLVELGVIQPSKVAQVTTGTIACADLDWLIRDGKLVLDAIGSINLPKSSFYPPVELAWTVPSSIASTINLDPSSKSLAGLLRYTISRAESRLIIVSPFLEQQGLAYLEQALKGALARGVDVLLISHSLKESSSPGYEALEYLRKSIPTARCFSTPKSNFDMPYVLVHSKVVIADDDFAVLSSANLTKYGLATHLEIGVGLSGKLAADLAMLFMKVIETDLVEPIPLVQP